jgi:hypothetical protein
MQWPLTPHSHGSILKENNCFFVERQTPIQSCLLFQVLSKEATKTKQILVGASSGPDDAVQLRSSQKKQGGRGAFCSNAVCPIRRIRTKVCPDKSLSQQKFVPQKVCPTKSLSHKNGGLKVCQILRLWKVCQILRLWNSSLSESGLPDFSWHNKPKRGKYTKIATKNPIGPEIKPNLQ